MFFLDKDIVEIIECVRPSLRKLENKNVVVTGSSGFLGKYFIKVMSEYNLETQNKINIIGVDNYVTSHNKIKNNIFYGKNIEIINGDATLIKHLNYKFDYIIHAAGIASPENYQKFPLETIDVSTNVLRELLEIAKRDKCRMLFFSSSEMYGDPTADNIPTKESYRGNVSCHGSRAPYDESKRLGETICWVYQTYFDVFVSIVRPFNVYGPGMMPNDYRVFPNFAKNLLAGESLKVYGNGEQTRTFCYITDAIIGFFKVLIDSAKPDVFNIGNPNPEIKLTDLANLIISLIKPDASLEIVNYPKSYPDNEPNRRCPDISKYETLFSFNPKISLEEGILRFYEWAKLHY